MRKSRFGEEQIIAILREPGRGEDRGGLSPTRDQHRRRSTSGKWKARYGGLEVSEARRLKALED
jgi:putative transposase